MNLPSTLMLSIEVNWSGQLMRIEEICRTDGRTFILYGYSSLGEDTPPDFLTSNKQRRKVCNWLKTGSKASDTGSEDLIKVYMYA